MSCSHLFLGLPIALLVLNLELRSGLHSAAFFSHFSLGEVAILSANFHFIFLWVLFQLLISIVNISRFHFLSIFRCSCHRLQYAFFVSELMVL